MFTARWTAIVLTACLVSGCSWFTGDSARSRPDKGIVGAWTSTGPQGMYRDSDARGRVLEFTGSGEFRWLKDVSAGTSPSGRRGKYTVSGSSLTFRYDDGQKETETQEFAIKGKTLLFRRGADNFKEYGDPYWDYFYRREAATGARAVPSRSSNILGLLGEKVSVAGSLTMLTKDFSTSNASGTYTTWTLDVKLTNKLPFDLDFGNTLIVAQLQEDGLATGLVRVRGADRFSKGLKTPAQPHLSYLLDDFDSTDGGRTVALAGASFVFESKGTHPPGAGFGRVEAGSEAVFFEEFHPNRWLKPEAVAGMLVVLPEVVATTPAGPERYRVIVSLRPAASGKDNATWVVKRLEFVPMRTDKLLELFTGTDTILFKKVLAANWMILADPQNAAREMSSVLGAKSQGSLLAACLTCFAQYGVAGFEKRAAELEYDASAPAGIQSLATGYLDKLNYTRPGLLSASCSAAGQPNAAGGSSSEGGPPLGANALVAVRFVPPGDTIIRRIVVEIGGSSNAKLSTYSDHKGRPGTRLAEFSGIGGDFRGTQETQAGQAYWLVVGAEAMQGWAEPSWARCARSDRFGSYASSSDGGARWTVSNENSSLKTTVYYTAAQAGAIRH